MGWSAVIVAAGKGSRMGTTTSKQYLPLRDKPILAHTLDIFEQMPETDEIILVVGEEDLNRVRSLIGQYGMTKVSAIVTGGAERQHSVRHGLEAVRDGAEWVMVHDAVRPMVRADHIRRLQKAAEESDAAVLAVPVKDTVKLVADGFIQSTPERSALWAVQTPQAFRLSLLKRAHALAVADGISATDDAMLVERMGVAVRIVEGDYRNIKITTPEDLIWAEALLQGGEGDENEDRSRL